MIKTLIIIILAMILVFLFSACFISSRCSRLEEQYENDNLEK